MSKRRTGGVDGTIEDSAGVILEERKRLSQSILWKLQRNFFSQKGVDAWRKGTVPHYVTSNPFIAGAYAKVILGFMRDCCAAAGTRQGQASVLLDPGQPLNIVELGSGPGRFAHHFLKKFRHVHANSVLRHLPFRFIMTDIAERNLEFWQTHPSLKPLAESGLLDFARFDAGRDEEVKLRNCGDVLNAGSVKNPVAVIANYFFDGIPQDAFFVEKGRLMEGLVTLSSPRREPDREDPDILSRVELSYDKHAVDSDYYQNPHWNEILRHYQSRLDDTAFLFPCGALRCFENLKRISGGRLLLLTGDKGYSREEDLLGRKEPAITKHGSFSMTVNYHAMGQYVQKKEGLSLNTGHRHRHLNISAFLLGNPPGDYVETLQAYHEAVECCGPDDFYTLKKAIETGYDGWTPEQVLSYVRLSGYDAKIVLACFPTLMDGLPVASESTRRELFNTVQRVWEVYFPMSEDDDVASYLGVLLYELGYYAEALNFFLRSKELYGPYAMVFFNMGLCHYGLGRMEQALASVNEALVLDADLEDARTLRTSIEAGLESSRLV
jgi:tetratricopeptide (TPR) repeat protein